MNCSSGRNVRLLLEYDGTDFSGWQIQPNARTVQGDLEASLEALFGRAIRTTAAGRTDAGVHAQGQVVNFPAAGRLSTDDIRNALNARLKPDVVVREVCEAPPGFNARRSARSRRYRYSIALHRKAIGRRYVWSVKGTLDTNAMQAAADRLVGDHDFTSFCIAAEERPHRLCRVIECRWAPHDGGLDLWMEANRFVRGMVRGVVGTLVEVGRGKRSPDSLVDVLAACNRSAAGPTAPPHGLCLHHVSYSRVSYSESSGDAPPQCAAS